MINGSFVFGMDDDDDDVFGRTVDWAIEHGITTATFHIQTPYPGTRSSRPHGAPKAASSRATGICTTRGTSSSGRRGCRREALKNGYDWAYREFYRWSSIARASLPHGTLKHQAKHFFYAAGWKKFEPLWDMLIRARQLTRVTPLLEAVLSRVTSSGGRAGQIRLPARSRSSRQTFQLDWPQSPENNKGPELVLRAFATCIHPPG